MSRWLLWFGAVVAVSLVTAGIFVHRAVLEEGILQNELATLSALEVNTAREWRTRFGFTKELQKGTSGAEVTLLQKTLAYGNYLGAKDVSGFYGNKTHAAVTALQKEEALPSTGKLDVSTREWLNKKYFEVICPAPVAAYPDLEMENVDKEHLLPLLYAPEDLVQVGGEGLPAGQAGIWTNGIICLRKGAGEALANMIRAAAKEGVTLGVTSGFRSAEVQKALYNYWVRVEGARAKESIAPPGGSEHQLGLAVDLTGASVGYVGTPLNFGEAAEGRWLEANAAKFGFVLSYPKGREAITSYIYEPWHYRFVGVTAAARIKEDRVGTAEYLALHGETLYPRFRGVSSGLELSARAAFAIYVPSSPRGEARVLLSKDSNTPHPIASITKLLTALAAEKVFTPGVLVPISSSAAREAIKEGQTRLEAGESFRVEDMLTLLLAESSNPAARALAEAAGHETFLGLMREEAKRLGLSSTTIQNVTGLDPVKSAGADHGVEPRGGHAVLRGASISEDNLNVATPREVAVLLREVLEQHPALRTILGSPEAKVRGTSGTIYRVRTTNSLLASTQSSRFSVIGGKTGETPRAKQALVFAAESPSQNGYVVGVVLESEDRFGEARKMLEWLYTSYDWMAQ